MARFWETLKHRSPVLARAGVIILILMIPTAIGLALDPRTLNGAPVWLKPLKFQLSVGLYLLTLAWFYGYAKPTFPRTRYAGFTAWMTVAAAVFEVGYITIQAGLGQASHYNTGDLVHGLLYMAMALGATLMTLAAALLGIAVARGGSGLAPAFRLSLVLGLLLTFLLGTGVGGMLGAGSGHWIGGTPSDQHGVPILGWSRDGGDLRIAHFLGIHALHILPAFGWLVARVLRGWAAQTMIWLGAAGYTGLTVALAAMAIAGRPLFPY